MQRDFSHPNFSSTLEKFSLELERRDTWSGISDPKLRRKLQNRLNQRAYRKRRLAQSDQVTEGRLVSPPNTRCQTQRPARWLSAKEAEFLSEQFSKSSFQSYTRGSSTAGHLIILTKLNVYRAFIQNLSTLGIIPHLDWRSENTISPFNICAREKIDDTTLPVSLRPTQIQYEIPHHPWLDFFPFRRMRDNLISARDKLDEGQLCVDIMGFWDISTKSCGLLVWGEPSDPKSWEITEEFLKKWPWVMCGVPELIESTNYWRRKRGEEVIFRYI
ncbi:Protein of unknown function DUF3425 [Penicillium concentricum]|uniref:BZIP domain-containing protein n=1 Tax=Penicillium concentricum TaxID=293559 RepID=A0A9W9RA81_9EURO|nr:Protein of unknown function DUF3425 [Penicillium concentricum]KAJ5356482.1 Protein of unknown function DUF3425 [Penicillium concentricum]